MGEYEYQYDCLKEIYLLMDIDAIKIRTMHICAKIYKL